MSAITEYRQDGLLTVERYLAFLRSRPDEERWQLIDGVAVMMNPPTIRHQKIGANLLAGLRDALESNRPDLVAVYGAGVRIEGYGAFLPEPDIVVVDRAADDTANYADRFYLAAEILSESNEPEYIALKLHRYREHSHNLYSLVISQRETRADVWSRAEDWEPVVLSSPADVLELPEFGFRCALRDLYRGTPLA